MIDTAAMAAELAAYVQSQGPSPESFGPHSPLLETHPLGSPAMTRLVDHIAARYGVRLGQDDLVSRHFRTVDCLVRLVVSKLLAPLNAGCLLCREVDAFHSVDEPAPDHQNVCDLPRRSEMEHASAG